VRFGLGRYGDLRTEWIMDDWIVAVAAPSVIEKYGKLKLPQTEDLAKYPLLHGDDLDWPHWATGDTRPIKALRGAFIDEPVSLLSASMAGMGFALLRWTIAFSELQAGRIVLASEHVVKHEFSYYFVCPEDYATFPKVAALRDWLLQEGKSFAGPPSTKAPTSPTAKRKR
jgi:LysR family glycine cleavage system transcriptional activator